MDNLRINADRLWRSLMELAQIGATPKGGVKRLTLTEEDRRARDLFARWGREAGLAVEVDAVGNVFARRAGTDPAAAPVAMGSHLDSQPSGGKFDGAYGVMAGLEVLRTLNDAGVATRAPIEVVSWTNEEGSRFTPVMMGSGVFANVFTLEHVRAQKDMTALRSPMRSSPSATPAPPKGTVSARTSRRTSSRGRCWRTKRRPSAWCRARSASAGTTSP